MGSGELRRSRYHVPNVVRALRTVEMLADRPEGAGVSQIASHLQVPKNSVFRITATLEDHGYLERGDDMAYRLSNKLLRLGYASVDQSGLIERAIDALRSLRDQTQETALLAVLAGHEGVVLEQIPSLHPVKVMVEIGHRFPMYAAAPGKALLAHLPEAEREPSIDRIKFTRLTKNTIASRKALRMELDEIRRVGYALDREESSMGVTCVAAAILNRRGHAVAALWVTGPLSRLGYADLDRVGAIVSDHARRISHRFGYHSREPATT